MNLRPLPPEGKVNGPDWFCWLPLFRRMVGFQIGSVPDVIRSDEGFWRFLVGIAWGISFAFWAQPTIIPIEIPIEISAASALRPLPQRIFFVPHRRDRCKLLVAAQRPAWRSARCVCYIIPGNSDNFLPKCRREGRRGYHAQGHCRHNRFCHRSRYGADYRCGTYTFR